MVGDRPAKFGAMGFVPLPDVAAAAREVDYVLDVLELDGINLLTHTGDRYLGHPEEDELYAELDRRRAVVFVHPVRPQALPPVDYPAGYTELVFDTTRAIANLLCTGTLAKYPNIRFIMSHMGGVTPFLLFRLSGLDDEPKLRVRFPDGVATYLRRLYYDVAQSAAPLSFRALLEIADPSRILFGTDYPFARNAEKVMTDTIEAVARFDGFDATLKRKIALDNARALFPRFAAIPRNQAEERIHENRAYRARPHGQRHCATPHRAGLRDHRLGSGREGDAGGGETRRADRGEPQGRRRRGRDGDLDHHRGQRRAEGLYRPERAARSRRQGQAVHRDEHAAADDRPRACADRRGEGRAADRVAGARHHPERARR